MDINYAIIPIVYALPFSWRLAPGLQMKGTFFSMLVGAMAALAVLYVGDFDHISQVVAAATMVIVVLLFIVGETIYEKIDCAVKELKNVPHKEPPASLEG